MSVTHSSSASSSISAVHQPAGGTVSVSVCWGEQNLELHAERAVYWLSQRTLIIADAHFGKAASFRAAGVPVPAGTTQANFDRLSTLLDRTAAHRLIVLGDLLHSSHGRTPETLDAMAHWRTVYNDLEIVLVRGNHDVHAGDPPPECNITCIDEPLIEEPFAFRHAPGTACGEAHPPSLCGHVHPCAVLHDVDGSSLRVPCFHVSPTQIILPAFGAFTGGHAIRAVEGDRVFAAWRGTISEIPMIVRT